MTPGSAESYAKFNYLLRPSKQVERKLIIEGLHAVSELGFAVRDYTYVGLGSVYYADFILFHRYLYIREMTCIEAAPIPRRMAFNKPLGFIRLRMETIAEALPTLSRRKQYLMWLDYDYPLSKDVLADVAGALTILAPGSVLVVTVDAEPRLYEEDEEDPTATRSQRESQRVAQFKEEFGRYCAKPIEKRLLAYNELPLLFSQVLRAQFGEVVSKRRPPVEFVQLFNFRYADGAQMLSLGGIVCAPTDAERLRASNLFALDFINDGERPQVISVPPLTVLEKQWLDQRIGRKTPSARFEIDAELLAAYRRYYRHYPTYYETIL